MKYEYLSNNSMAFRIRYKKNFLIFFFFNKIMYRKSGMKY